MNPDQLAFGFLEYVVFLLSTTCHEAAHALVAKWGGDTTALEGGQVSLNPWPHIRREPFGMVLMPLIGIASGSGLIGWASAPYNPKWAIENPKHAARMSLAGPVANFGLAALAGILMRNTLILTEQIKENLAAGLDDYHAVIEATVQRTRPVILTALAAVLAFIPLTHSVFWGSMAYTLIGGTAAGTLLILLFLPALHAAWFRINPTADEAHSPSQGVARLSELIAAPAE